MTTLFNKILNKTSLNAIKEKKSPLTFLNSFPKNIQLLIMQLRGPPFEYTFVITQLNQGKHETISEKHFTLQGKECLKLIDYYKPFTKKSIRIKLSDKYNYHKRYGRQHNYVGKSTPIRFCKLCRKYHYNSQGFQNKYCQYYNILI